MISMPERLYRWLADHTDGFRMARGRMVTCAAPSCLSRGAGGADPRTLGAPGDGDFIMIV